MKNNPHHLHDNHLTRPPNADATGQIFTCRPKSNYVLNISSKDTGETSLRVIPIKKI